MTTQILGFLIILGAIIILVARWHLNRAEDDPEVLEAATGRLRYELEQSADEIINRMSDHVDRLEKLLREADYKSELLQQRIDQFQMLQLQYAANAAQQPVQTGRPVTAENYDGGAEAWEMPSAQVNTGSAGDDYAETAAQWQDIPEMQEAAYDVSLSGNYAGANPNNEDNSWQEQHVPQAGEADMAYSSPDMQEDLPAMSETDQKAWDFIREASMKLEAEYEARANTMQQSQQTDALQQAVNIQSGNIENLVSAYSPEEDEDDTGAAAKELVNSESAANQARDMLLQGYDAETVAQATGLGIGAVHLIQQLQKR